MPRKKTSLTKQTMNFRSGDYDKMGEMFPKIGAGPAIRKLVSRFIDQHYVAPTPEQPHAADLNIELD